MTGGSVISSASRSACTCGRVGITTVNDCRSGVMTVIDAQTRGSLVIDGHNGDTANAGDGTMATESGVSDPVGAEVVTDRACGEIATANGEGVGARLGAGGATDDAGDDATTPKGDDGGVSLDAATATGGAGADVATANGTGVSLGAGVIATRVADGRSTRASSLLPSMAVNTIRTALAPARQATLAAMSCSIGRSRCWSDTARLRDMAPPERKLLSFRTAPLRE